MALGDYARHQYYLQSLTTDLSPAEKEAFRHQDGKRGASSCKELG
jgi:hypothetical protein